MIVRVVIADDHPIVRSGVRAELNRDGRFEVVGEALNGDDALRLALEQHPDVLLLDVNMPGLKAVKVLRQIKREPHPCRVVVLTAYSDPGTVMGMLKAGADGYILKDEDPVSIPEALHAVIQGQRWISPSAATRVEDLLNSGKGTPGDVLTGREQEVLSFLVDGQSNKEIAVTLQTSERTIEYHVSNILLKLGVKSRTEAAVWAKEHGLA